MINIVVALPEEARPLIDHYRLKRLHSCKAFPVYTSSDIQLIVSGIGKINAATATGFLAAYNPVGYTAAWLNLGIAGCGNRQLGTAVLASRVTDAVSGRHFFPSILFEFEFDAAYIRCVNNPVNTYEDNSVIDMESAGFYPAAMRFSTVELIHCCKIISDNEAAPLETFDKTRVVDLVSEQLPFIDGVIIGLAAMTQTLLPNDAIAGLIRTTTVKVRLTSSR